MLKGIILIVIGVAIVGATFYTGFGLLGLILVVLGIKKIKDRD